MWIVDVAIGALTGGGAGVAMVVGLRRRRVQKPKARAFCGYDTPRSYKCFRMASLTCEYGFCRECCKAADCPDYQVMTAEKQR